MHHTDPISSAEAEATLKTLSTRMVQERDNLLGENEDMVERLLEWHDELVILAKRLGNGHEVDLTDEPTYEPLSLEPSMVRAARERAGLSPAELAKKAGVNEMTLRNIEEGRTKQPQESTMAKIAETLRSLV